MYEKNNMRMRATFSLTAYIYYFLTANLLFYVSVVLPGAWLVFFPPSLLNIVAIGFMFPGFAALVSCTIKHKEADNLATFGILKHFARGYKNNFKDTIKYCFVYALLFFVVTFTINNIDNETPRLMIITLIALTILTTLLTYMMIIAARFEFRTRDLLRVSLYCMLMHPKRMAKILVIYAILFFAQQMLSVFTILLFVSPIVYLIIHFAYPVLDDVHALFAKKPETS